MEFYVRRGASTYPAMPDEIRSSVAAQLAQGIPRAAMSPAASGGCTVEPLPRRTSDAQRDLLDERLT
jgi:hypothetical protein